MLLWSLGCMNYFELVFKNSYGIITAVELPLFHLAFFLRLPPFLSFGDFFLSSHCLWDSSCYPLLLKWRCFDFLALWYELLWQNVSGSQRCRVLNLLSSLALGWHLCLTASNSAVFRAPGFIVSPVGKGGMGAKKMGRREKGIEKERKKEGIKRSEEW